MESVLPCLLESCCTSVGEVLQAQRNGASRIELCERLDVGGVTPSRELIEQVLQIATVPINVLIRCRGGDFHYNTDEITEMIGSIQSCRTMGMNGVVIGALDAAGDVDLPSMRRMMTATGSMSVTFHRAFDVCHDPLSALDDIIALGCSRLLTSGHEADAYRGRFMIAQLVRRAAKSDLVVMAGCGVRPSNIDDIVKVSGVRECHASAAYFEKTSAKRSAVILAR